MKAIGYIRVSTQGQVNDGVSMEAQEAKIKAWAELNEYEIEHIYKDNGISGKQANNRAGLQDALNAVDKGNALVVYSLSRLARSTKDTLEISEYLSKKKADLVSLSEKIDTTTASGKMVFRMLAVLNEFERDQISERTKTALQYKKSKMEKTGGDVPFGYDVSKGKLIENHKEQNTIGSIKRLHSQGYSLRGICKEMELRGCRTKKGRSNWNPKTVSMILKRAA